MVTDIPTLRGIRDDDYRDQGRIEAFLRQRGHDSVT
jgi:hypothetical protein